MHDQCWSHWPVSAPVRACFTGRTTLRASRDLWHSRDCGTAVREKSAPFFQDTLIKTPLAKSILLGTSSTLDKIKGRHKMRQHTALHLYNWCLFGHMLCLCLSVHLSVIDILSNTRPTSSSYCLDPWASRGKVCHIDSCGVGRARACMFFTARAYSLQWHYWHILTVTLLNLCMLSSCTKVKAWTRYCIAIAL